MLPPKDHGCTHPGCDMPATLWEIHHVDDWAQGGPTDITPDLRLHCTLGLLGKGWRTTNSPTAEPNGSTPSSLPSTTNDFHHPNGSSRKSPATLDVRADVTWTTPG